MNTLRTAFLLTALTLLLIFVGQAVGGRDGAMIAFFFALIMNVGSYWFSDKLVLKMYRAQPVSPNEAPRLYSMVQELALSAGLPMPRVYIIPSQSPNAFATGRNKNHAVVAVTQGILSLLDENELRGVLAHELAHVRNRDMLVGSIAATLAGAISMLGIMIRWGAMFGGFGGRDDRDNGGVFGLLAAAILAPIAATIIQLAVSRSREYGADDSGARIAGSPYGLADALAKLERGAQARPLQANPASAHLFIVNPLRGKSIWNLLSTHPPIEERIRRLRAMRP
ncbi:MAG: zinc metalloprotease HtpX [Candidatus Abyssobacteria bacterium SURF_5]|uniref:Protease HtpX homolog n=1 Tax=Abyssobacteria bacterium (strain SURF_5) TaxID=2093360 RepID=A0A3A4NXB5_ABYX5|nr:MAG: zinc metalloprotease HtpX [Candidatus Abyssubacteria bacterium SURF_5]